MDDDMPSSQDQKSNPSKFLVDFNRKELDKFFNLDKKTKTTLSVAALALLMFVFVGYFSVFKDKLFQNIYQKPPSSASEDINRVWKSYTSNQYKFSFKYPNEFKSDRELGLTPTSSLEQGVSLYKDGSKFDKNKSLLEGTAIVVLVISDKKQIDAQKNMLTQKNSVNEDKALLPSNLQLPKNTSTNAFRMYNKSGVLESNVNIFQDDSKKPQAIHFNCISPGHPGACETLLPQILSTFKLTN